MKRIILAGMFLLISFNSLNAQWAITYGGSYSESAHSIQQTSDGGYIIAGSTTPYDPGPALIRNFWVLKLFSNGDVEWQQAYDVDGDEYAHSIQQTSDGGYIVTGSNNRHFWVLKLKSNGDIEWQKTYGGSNVDYAHSIQQTSDGGYIVAGDTSPWGTRSPDFWVLKLKSNGDIEWQRTYGGSSYEEAPSIQQTSDGGYIVAGINTGDFWVLKLKSNGDIEWQRTYGGSNGDYAHSIQQTSDGGYIVAGETRSFGAGAEIWVLKLSPTGDIEWQKTYGGTKWDKAHSIQQTSDGGYIVAGSTNLHGHSPYFEIRDFLVLKLFSNGDIEWQKTYGSDYSTDEAYSVQQTMDGGYIVAGETNSWGAGGEIWVLKLLANGDINPRCAFIKSSNAEVSDTDITAVDTDITPEDTDTTAEDTDISPQETDASIYKLCVSDICTLTLSTSFGGGTDPRPGTYTYDTGIEVTLEAIPDNEYDFSGWSGNVEANINPITIIMDGDKTISANFDKPTPGVSGEEWGGGGGVGDPGCFIATAAYGSHLHPHIDILRNFRDKYFMPNKFGQEIVGLYYKYSPSVADLITKHKVLRVGVRINLLPIIAVSYLMLHLGPVITAVMLVFIFMFPVFLAWCYKKKRRRHRKETKNKMIESFDT